MSRSRTRRKAPPQWLLDELERAQAEAQRCEERGQLDTVHHTTAARLTAALGNYDLAEPVEDEEEQED